MTSVPPFCDAQLRWDGHPDGIVPCELDPGHDGRHSFSWQPEEWAGPQWRAIQWTDQTEGAVPAERGGGVAHG